MTPTTPAAADRRVVMFVHNDATNDSRVLREAATLASAGYAVTLVARTRRTDPPRIVRERLGAVDVIRVPLPTRWRRTMTLLVTPWRQWREDATAIRAMVPRPDHWLDIARLMLTRLAALAISVLLLPAGLLWFAVGRSRYRELVQWTLRWRFSTLGWNRAAATAAPSAAVYHGHDLSALPAAAQAATRNGGLLVYDSHEVFLESGANARRPRWARAMLARLERRLATRAAALVTVNDALAEILTARLPIRRTVVVHNCPPHWTPPAAPPGHLRRAAGIGPEVPLVLYHGGFSAHRGLEELAAALLEPGMDGVHAAYLGYGSMRGWLDTQAADPTYGGRLHVVDAVPPDVLLDWVSDADAGVMAIQPSTLNHRLSTPNKLFECMAAGVPSVVSDMPGMRAIALDPKLGPVGEVCDPADPAAIAAAIRRILDLGPGERAALRARCLRAAHERWNWDGESRQLIALYADLAPGAVAPADPAVAASHRARRARRPSRSPRMTASVPVRQRAVVVLPSTGEFDSRTYRIARTLHERGHEVSVLARWKTGVPRLETHPVGYPIIRVEAQAIDGLPLPGVWRALRGLWRIIRRGTAPATAAANGITTGDTTATSTSSDPGWAHPTARGRSGGLAGYARRAEVFLMIRAHRRAALAVGPPADIYHGMAPMGIPVALGLGHRHRARVVYDARDIYVAAANMARAPRPVRALLARLERGWARAADRVFTVNRPYAEELATRLGVDLPVIVMNGSYRFHPPVPREGRFHEALQLAPSTSVVLYQGGLSPERGIEELLEAIRDLPDTVLVLMGYGELEPMLRDAVTSDRYRGKAFLLPAVPPTDVLAWVACADVVGVPFQPTTINHRLSTPNKFLEAMAAGVPAVVSDDPGMGPIATATGCGIAVDPRDPKAIAAAIREILSGGPAEREAWRARALAAAHGEYSWEVQVQALLAEYGRLTGRPW